MMQSISRWLDRLILRRAVKVLSLEDADLDARYLDLMRRDVRRTELQDGPGLETLAGLLTMSYLLISGILISVGAAVHTFFPGGLSSGLSVIIAIALGPSSAQIIGHGVINPMRRTRGPEVLWGSSSMESGVAFLALSFGSSAGFLWVFFSGSSGP